MGVPLEADATVGGPQLPQPGPGLAARLAQPENREWMDAPLRLQAESYEDFSQRLLSLGQDSEAPSVEDELRRLEIDPAIFYGNAQRLGLRRFSSDDHDPIAAAAAPCPAASAIAQAVEVADDDHVTGGSWAEPTEKGALFAPPLRGSLVGGAVSDEEEEDSAVKAAPGLHVPRHFVEDEYEEVLDAGLGETRGGRWNHATPQDLGGSLQVDSLTDDGDEDDFFREEVIEAEVEATGEEEEEGEGDTVEAFSLDPDFDYDNVKNLTSRLG